MKKKSQKPKRKVLKYRLTSVSDTPTRNNLLINYLQTKLSNRLQRKKEITKSIEARIIALAWLERYKKEGVINQEDKKNLVIHKAIESVVQLNSFIEEIRTTIQGELGIDISGVTLSLNVNSKSENNVQGNGENSSARTQRKEEVEEAEPPQESFSDLAASMFD